MASNGEAGLRELLIERFDRIEARLDRVEARMDRFETQLARFASGRMG